MKVSKLGQVIALCALLGMAQPVFAANDNMDKVVAGAMMPVRAGGVASALVVGIPVAATRDSYHTYIDWTEKAADKVGGKDCGPCCALVSIGTLPAAIVWGTVHGIFHGGRNAVTHGYNEPFTHQSFSLDKDYAN